MKISLILLISNLFFYSILVGQNVGVGTTSPTAKLHIHEDINSSIIQRITSTQGELIMGYNPTNEGILGTVSNHDLRIRTNNINRFTIAKTGNIGIGLTLPTQKLQLENGSIFLSGLGSTDDKGFLIGEADSPIYGWIYDGIGSGVDNQLQLREYLGTPSDLLTIKADGRFGFGTESPSKKVEVANGSLFLSNLGNTAVNGFLLGESTNPTYGWIYDGSGNGNSNKLILREYLGTESDLLEIKGDGEIKAKNLTGMNRRALYAEADGTITAAPEELYYSGGQTGFLEDFKEFIHLPKGAKLISIEFRYRDASDEGELKFRVIKTNFEATISETLISFDTGIPISNPSYQTIFINFSNSISPIDNEDFVYDIRVLRDEGSFPLGISFLNYRINYILE